MTETAVQVYDFEGKNVRTMVLNEEPWFVGRDIAEALEYKKTRNAIERHVDDEDKQTLLWRDCPETGRTKIWKGNDHSNKVIINESGMYSLIFGSKLKSAKKFKHWVTSEVLPELRKTGSYNMKPKVTPSYMIEDPVKRAQQWIVEQQEKQQLENKIEEDKDKVQFAIDLASSDHSVLVGTFAKQLKQAGFETGQNRLFEQFRKGHYLMSASGKDRHNLPTQ